MKSPFLLGERSTSPGDFTADAIAPFAAEWDEKHHFPRDVIKASAELGFGAIYVSEESGGIGLGRLEAALTVLTDTDLALRSAGQSAPQMALVERAMIRLAWLSRSR